MWDARCAGIYTGIGTCVVWAAWHDRLRGRIPAMPLLGAVSALLFPLIIDVVSLRMAIRPPSNEIRFLTGILFGAGFGCWYLPSVLTVVAPGHLIHSRLLSSFGEYGFLVLTLACVYAAKWLNHVLAYVMLNALSIVGFVALITSLCMSLIVMFARAASRWFSRAKGKGGCRCTASNNYFSP